jgi:hypothetical protein
LYLWNEGALRAIGDSLGKFIALDSKLLTAPVRKMGRVLVEMDIYCGLPETIEIEWRGRRIAQSLDYLGLPFGATFAATQVTFVVTALER